MKKLIEVNCYNDEDLNYALRQLASLSPIVIDPAPQREGGRDNMCPYPFPGDDGTAEHCKMQNHCGCDECSGLAQEPVGIVMAVSIGGYPMADSRGVEWLSRLREGDKLYTSPQPTAERDGYSSISNEFIEFLRGTGQLDGLWFGDGRQRYWWRKYLPAAPTGKKGE